jgi:hypothetical protein
MAYVYAFVRRTVVLRLQIGPKPHEHRGLDQRLRPDAVLDMEGVEIDRTGEGHVR